MAVAKMSWTKREDLIEITDVNGDARNLHKQIGHNTMASHTNFPHKDYVCEVSYHGNTIVTFNKDLTTTFSNEGWCTTTTSGRLNQFAQANFPGSSVYIRDFVMFYQSPTGVKTRMEPAVKVGTDGEVVQAIRSRIN